MSKGLKRFLLSNILLCIFFLNKGTAESKATLLKLVDKHCFSCHGKEEVEGKFNFIDFLKTGKNDVKVWTSIYKSIQQKDMPPEDAEPLNDENRNHLLDLIKGHVKAQKNKSYQRLLTPFEIQNTVEKIFDIEDSSGYFTELKKIYTHKEFLTQQQNLITPHYLESLHKGLQRVMNDYVGVSKNLKSLNIASSFGGQMHTSIKTAKGLDLRWPYGEHINLIQVKTGRELPPAPKYETLPRGSYEMTLKMTGMNYNFVNQVEGLYGKRLRGFYPEKIDFLEVEFYDTFYNDSRIIERERPITVVKVYPGQKEFKINFTLRKDSHISFRLISPIPNLTRIAGEAIKHAGKTSRKELEAFQKKHMRIANYKFPMVRMSDVSIRGPFAVKGNSYSIQEGEKLDDLNLRAKFKMLHQQNGLKNNTIYTTMYKKFLQSKISKEEAYRNALISFFMSDDFLLIKQNRRSFEDYSRFISYSLLKLPPGKEFNDQLMKAFKLRKYEGFINWLISRPEFSAFTRQFTYQWLQLEEIKISTPDPKQFKVFYEDSLEEAFTEESSQFIHHLLIADRPVSELVSANYSFINAALAKHYKVKDFSHGAGYKKHSMPFTQGGILTQGAFLTATANGVDALPIKRADWILKNLMDKHMPAPPQDAALQGRKPKNKAAGFRETLEIHSETKACYHCHKHIDPIAILMSPYDAIGSYKFKNRLLKEVYINEQPVKHVGAFKKLFEQNSDKVAKSFTRALMKYTLGRDLIINDEVRLDRIIEETKEEDFRSGKLLKKIIKKYFF